MVPGDIVLIRFPQTDLHAGGLHLSLVVASILGRYADVLLALISSRTYQTIPDFDETIDPSDSDYGATGLKVRSVIRLARLATVESSVIDTRLGNISPERLRQLKERLVDWLRK